MDIDVDEYVNFFRFDIMEVVYVWVKGVKFVEIMKFVKVFEGSLI